MLIRLETTNVVAMIELIEGQVLRPERSSNGTISVICDFVAFQVQLNQVAVFLYVALGLFGVRRCR